MSDDCVAELSGVSKRYDNGSEALYTLRGVDLRLPRGAYLALVGASGSGKSCLLYTSRCV